MPKWVKFILAILLLPVCVDAGQTLWMGTGAVRWRGYDTRAHHRRRGVLACDLSAFTQTDVIYVFGHELTHALWVWLLAAA